MRYRASAWIGGFLLGFAVMFALHVGVPSCGQLIAGALLAGFAVAFTVYSMIGR